MEKNHSPNNIMANFQIHLTFDENDFPTIFDAVIKIFPFSKTLSSLLIALLIYLFGLLFSFIFGFSNLYIHTYLFVHVALAIFLALAIITISKKEIIDFFVFVRPCFSVNDKTYVKLINNWMKTLFKNKGLWLTWFFLTILILWGIVSIFYPYPLVNNLLILLSNAPFKEILTSEWFIGDKIPKLILIIIMLLIGSLPLSLGIWASIVFMPLINEFTNMSVIPISGALLTLLRKPTELFLRVSFIWFILTGSSGIVLFKSVDLFSILLILLISTGGIIAFFIPQFAFHKLLIKSHNKFVQMALDVYTDIDKENKGTQGKKLLTTYCRDISESAKPKDLWVFDIKDIILLLLGQIMSLLISLPQIFKP